MGKKIFVDLTHPFSADIPLWPYFAKPKIDSNPFTPSNQSKPDRTSDGLK